MAIEVSAGFPRPVLALSGSYRSYVLLVLVLVGTFAWIDRQVLAMVLQSVKREFSLSDTQLGMLGGVAFGLFYSTLALPVAWLADRFNRRNIIALALGLWSIATAVCGAATGYSGLFLARMGVGVGEAGAGAPSQSIISDLFPPQRRGLALGLLYSYMPLGYVASYSLGGWLNDEVGWRAAFLIFGVPGVLLALLVRVTVPEPLRGRSESRHISGKESAPQFWGTLRYFLRRPTLRHLPIAGAAHGIGMSAAGVWLPAFFIRTFGMSSTAIGMRLALIFGVAGLAGTLGGGYLADRLAGRRDDAAWYPRLCAIVLCTTLPFTIGMYLAKSATLALALFVVPTVLNHMILGPVLASVQNLAGPSRRAMAAAFYTLLVNLISYGAGPLVIGVLSDFFNARLGSDALRYSLMFLVPSSALLAAIYFALAARNMRADLEGVET
jgi:predicted MFS family arabinose efflux permease